MKTGFSQRGIGLIEVLVALLVLAIGILGFVALQYRAVEATSEANYRIQAINIARDLAERMRVNRSALSTYKTETSNATTQKQAGKSCLINTCTTTELADFDVAEVANRADSLGMTVNMLNCPGNSDGRNCIYVAWGDTSATNDAASEPPVSSGDCTRGTSYVNGSTCVIMETY